MPLPNLEELVKPLHVEPPQVPVLPPPRPVTRSGTDDDQSEELPQNHFVGSWSNVDKNTQCHIRIKISKDDKSFQVCVLYKCSPPNWSQQTTLHLLGPNAGATAKDYGFASWNDVFADAHIVMHLENDKLMVELYRLFKDDSGRSDYRLHEVFERLLE